MVFSLIHVPQHSQRLFLYHRGFPRRKDRLLCFKDRSHGFRFQKNGGGHTPGAALPAFSVQQYALVFLQLPENKTGRPTNFSRIRRPTIDQRKGMDAVYRLCSGDRGLRFGAEVHDIIRLYVCRIGGGFCFGRQKQPLQQELRMHAIPPGTFSL